MAFFGPSEVWGKHKGCGGDVIARNRIVPLPGESRDNPVFGPGQQIMEGLTCEKCQKDCSLDDIDLSHVVRDIMAPFRPPPKIGGLVMRTCSRCNQPISYTSGGVRVPVCPNCGIMLHPTY